MLRFALAILAMLPTAVQAEQEAVVINYAALEGLGSPTVIERVGSGDSGGLLPSMNMGGDEGRMQNMVTAGSGAASPPLRCP